MLIRHFAVWACSVSLTVVLGAGAVFCQDFPSKPIRIVTADAGGGSDFVARLVALGLASNLGQQVIVDNRGGSGVIPALAVAKARPGELNDAGALPGSTTHISSELFKVMTGVNIVRVPFKGNGPSVIALLGGQVQLMFASASGVVPHIKSGRLRALAVTTAQPSALFPGLPTVAASGLPGYEAASTSGIFAPAATPVPVINRLNQEIVRVLGRPDVREKFASVGVEIGGTSPEEFAAKVKSEMARLGKVIKDGGIRAQ